MVALIVGAGIGYSGIAGNASTKTETLTTATARVSTEIVTSETTLMTTSVRTVTLTQNISVPCQVGPWSPESNSIVLPNGTVVTQVFWPVFLMKPGSQATVCVIYHNPYNQTIPANVGAEIFAWGPNASALYRSPRLTINASQNTLALSLGQNATLVFGLDALSNSIGFYGLFLFQRCGMIPVAVGYQASQVNLNDFPGLFGISTCQAIFLNSQITGFSGGTIAYYTCTLTPLPKTGPQTQYCK